MHAQDLGERTHCRRVSWPFEALEAAQGFARNTGPAGQLRLGEPGSLPDGSESTQQAAGRARPGKHGTLGAIAGAACQASASRACQLRARPTAIELDHHGPAQIADRITAPPEEPADRLGGQPGFRSQQVERHGTRANDAVRTRGSQKDVNRDATEAGHDVEHILSSCARHDRGLA